MILAGDVGGTKIDLALCRFENGQLLTVHDHNPNRADVRFLIEGAPLPEDASDYQRIVLLFDGTDEDAVAQAREHWGAAKAAGHAVTYWQPDEQGRWQQKA